MRGDAYFNIHEFDSAIDDYSQALKQDPNYDDALFGRGMVLTGNGEVEKGIDHFKVTLSVDPTYQKAHHNVAIAYYLTLQNQRALDAVNHSLKLNPDNKSSVLLKQSSRMNSVAWMRRQSCVTRQR